MTGEERVPRATSFPRLVVEAIRGITRQQVAATFLLGCALSLYRTVVTVDIRFAQFIFVGDQMKAFALLVALVVADRVTGRDPDRRGVYAAAVVVASIIVVPMTLFVVWGLIRLFVGVQTPPAPGLVGFVLNILFELLMIGSAAIWVINDRRRAQRARMRLHVVALQRIAAERASVESELQAMQARVEPMFLFNTLAHVRRLYAAAPAAGERLLDALIAYLRAAVPKARGTTSTVGQELDLVRGFVAVAQARAGGSLRFSMDAVPASVASVRMPAMLLLPLVDHALSRGSIDGLAGGGASIRIGVVAEADALRFGITTASPYAGESSTDRVEEVRARLHALYGTQGRVTLTRTGGGSQEIRLVIPPRPGPRADAGLLEAVTQPVGATMSRAPAR